MTMEQNKKYSVLVAGAIKSVADRNIVAYASDIYDSHLKMTLQLINSFEGSTHGDYAWRVLNKAEYDNIEHLEHVLYFIVGDDEVVDSEVRLDGTTLILNAPVRNLTVAVNGTLANETLTL